jgi:hypothetical protein
MVQVSAVFSVIDCWLMLDAIGNKSWEKSQISEFEE